MKNTLGLLFALFIFGNLANAQKMNFKHNGFFIKAGIFGTGNSLAELNTRLALSPQLTTFNSLMNNTGLGYYWVTKNNFLFEIETTFSSDFKETTNFDQSITSSTTTLNFGNEILNNERFILTPKIGVGLGILTLTMEETSGFASSTNFNNLLAVNKKGGTLTNSHAVLSTALVGTYKLKVGDSVEELENGKIISKRQLPISLEIGYRYGKELFGWSNNEVVNNPPTTHFLGYFATLRFSQLLNQKRFKAN